MSVQEHMAILRQKRALLLNQMSESQMSQSPVRSVQKKIKKKSRPGTPESCSAQKSEPATPSLSVSVPATPVKTPSKAPAPGLQKGHKKPSLSRPTSDDKKPPRAPAAPVTPRVDAPGDTAESARPQGASTKGRPPKENIEHENLPDGEFQLTEEERQIILNSKKAGDLPFNLRARCYNAIRRQCQNIDHPNPDVAKINDSVSAKWDAASNAGNKGKYTFLVDWAKDCKGVQMTVFQDHDSSQFDGTKDTYVWQTKMEYYASKGALSNKEMKEYCDKVLAKSKTRKHQQKEWKDDPDMTQYKILYKAAEHSGNDNRKRTRMAIAADVDDDAKESTINRLAYVERKVLGGKPMLKYGPEQNKKKKLSLEETRMEKVKCDTAMAKNIAAQIEDL